MVLAERVGRPRRFGVGLLLTAVTLGVYGVYWHYKAHNELYRQFELSRESRDEGMVWLVLGLVFPPVLLGYLWTFSGNVAYVRERMDLPRRQTPARFVTFVALAMGLVLAGLLAMELAVAALGPDATDGEMQAALTPTVPLFLGCALAAFVLLVLAYHRLQLDVNELWAAYDARVAHLRANPLPPEPILTQPAVAAGTHRYYADLAPSAVAPLLPAQPPPPEKLQERWEAMRAENPGLSQAEEVDALLAGAVLGNREAHLRATELLADIAASLDERRDVLLRRERLLEAMEALEARLSQGEVEEATYDAERLVLEGDWEALRARLDELDSRLFRPAA